MGRPVESVHQGKAASMQRQRSQQGSQKGRCFFQGHGRNRLRDQSRYGRTAGRQYGPPF
jgi:hypothetical protein